MGILIDNTAEQGFYFLVSEYIFNFVYYCRHVLVCYPIIIFAGYIFVGLLP